MTADSIPRGARANNLRLLLVAAAIFFVVLGIGFALLALMKLPNYGSWTGVQPLEVKLEMLRDFSDAGEIDALAFGSSIVDFGFSAKYFSELMSKESGREYRTFNFSTGAAQMRTLPKLYKLARLVTKPPKNLFVIVPAEQKLAEDLANGSPDLTLRQSPVGEVLHHPWLLPINWHWWNAPVVRNAPAARDVLLYGDYRGLQRVMGHPYPLNENGDRVSYLMTWKVDDLPRFKTQNELSVRPVPASIADGPDKLKRTLEFYFAHTDIAAMTELRELVERDGVKLFVVAHAQAATLWQGPSANAQYAAGRRDFFHAVTTKLGATFIDPVEAIKVPTHDISDTTHLNIHGARLFTRAVFAALAGKPFVADEEDMEPPPGGLFSATDKTFTPFAALLRRPANESHPLIHFRMMRSAVVPPLPKDDLFVALRTPENVDIVLPAIRIGPSDFIAEVNLPPSAHAQSLVLRLLTGEGPHKVALGNPVEDYEWLTAYPRLGIVGSSRPGVMDVMALPPIRAPGQSLYLALKSGKRLPSELTLRLVPLSPPSGTPLDLARIPSRADGLVKVALPKTVTAGTYEVRVYDAATGAQLGQSQPVEVDKAATVALGRPPRLGEGEVEITWSGIRTPAVDDWVGVFTAGGSPDRPASELAAERFDFAFTRGARAGVIRLPISASFVPKLMTGEYEIRFYTAGGWKLLTASAPFKFEAGGTPPAAGRQATAAPPPVPASASNAKVSADPHQQIGNGTLKVKWTGIEKPSPQDWVGLFPADGRDESRIVFTFIGGKPEGEIDLPISAALATTLAKGEYDVRLFAAGGWTLLARGDRLKFDSANSPGAKGK